MENFNQFTDLVLPERLLIALHKMGFVTPTPVQKETIPAALKGHDVLGTAQTGTGKTAAFGIPLLNFIHSSTTQRALVLAPTRELALQIHQVLNQMGKDLQMKGTVLIGGESFGRQAQHLRRGTDYIVATPGRLIDHLKQRTVNLSTVGMVVLDEVDRMLDMGFMPQVREIVRYLPEKRQTLLFSATLPTEITHLARSLMNNPVRVAIGSVTQTAAQVNEATVKTTQAGKNAAVLKEIQEREGLILIFTRTKSRADSLSRYLRREGHKVVCLHGGKTQSQRSEALDRFRTKKSRIMVATDLAGRGIDIIDIEHVINYDVPGSREDYIHRIGRTGRAGRAGNAVSFLVEGDMDGQHVVAGTKRTSSVVFRSRKRAVSMR